MKHTAVQSVKFLKLKRRLSLPLWQTIGVLEALWIFTQTNAPRGDIGRYSNEDIAAGIDWAGDHDFLMASLVATGWVDECPESRLVIHDWADHCPNWVKGNLKNKGEDFAKPHAVSPGPSPTPRSGTIVPHQVPDHSPPPPNLTKPNLTQPNQKPFADPPKAAGSSAGVSAPEPEEKSAAKEKRKGKPNPLFDAIAEITGSDPTVSGAHVGKITALLNAASPPYTPDDVREFGRRFHELCPWAANPPRAPNLGEIEKYIGKLRIKPPPPPAPTRAYDMVI